MAQRIALEDGAWLDYWPRLIADDQLWMARLLGELPLAGETYHMMGRVVAAPRLLSYHGDPESAYVYSRVLHEPAPWTPSLARLRDMVHQACGLGFNAVLCNYYRGGGDSMGWHADAEPEVGPSPADRWIASVSLGAARRFVLRHKTARRGGLDIELGHGDLLIMRGTTQTYYRHALPKTKVAVGERLNLTFRHIVPRDNA